MADTLVVFGATYNNVSGIIAKDPQGNDLTFERGGGGSISLQDKTVSYSPTESSQSDTVTADSGYDGLNSVSVSVDAIATDYVGSGITRRSSSDLTASGAAVTVPSGYYASQGTKSVTTTTHPNPTASVNSSTGLVTASHTQTAGYVSAGTTTGTLQLTTQAAKTVTPTTSSQTAVASGRYTTGTVTVGAIPSEYIVPAGTVNITSNGTVDVAQYASANVNVSGGGGASNIVEGTFNYSASGAQTINLGYTGSGYPIMLMIFPDEGGYDSSGDYYSKIDRYSIAQFSMVKGDTSTAPTYSNSGSANYGSVGVQYKSSTSSATSYSSAQSRSANTFTSSAANTTNTTVARLLSGNRLSVYIKSTSYGFSQNITYRYIVVYSS